MLKAPRLRLLKVKQRDKSHTFWTAFKTIGYSERVVTLDTITSDENQWIRVENHNEMTPMSDRPGPRNGVGALRGGIIRSGASSKREMQATTLEYTQLKRPLRITSWFLG